MIESLIWKHIENKNNKFSEFMKMNSTNNRKLVLFGASKFGVQVFNYCREKNIQVDLFCDNDKEKHGRYLQGVEIISINSLKSLNEFIPKKLVVLITSEYWVDIKKQLADYGINNIYYFSRLAYYEKFLGFTPHYNMDYVLKNKNEIEKALNMLEDDISRTTFLNIIRYRLTSNINYIYKIYCEDQYFPEELVELSENEIFIDAGAYIGDTLSKFVDKTEGIYKEIHAFEPDSFNFEKLVERISLEKLKNVFAYNKGIYDKDCELNFIQDGIESNISDTGSIKIKVVKLDEFIKDKKATFVKMDIEGSEINALKGVENILRTNYPKLAICIYHKPSDLWMIPIYINSKFPKYKLYIRHHGKTGFQDTVLYALKD